MNELQGSFAVLITPMDEYEQINLEGLKSNIDWLINQGIPGICVTGSTGEFSSLTAEERCIIAETAVKHINGRVKCMIGTAAETTKDTIYFTQHAKRIGADGVLIINPYYCLPTDEEIYQHYKAVSEAADITIMAYNNPAHSGVDMKPELLAKIGSLKNVEYVKDASGDLRRIPDIIRLTKGKTNVFCGGEDLAFENFILGASGWISVCANIIPRKAQQLFEMVNIGKKEEARELFYEIYPLLEVLEHSPKAIQIVKFCLDQMGLAGGACRLPRMSLNIEEKAQVVGLLKDIKIM